MVDDGRKEIVIRARVTEPQALALQLMLETWNRLGSIGSSRYVAFYADGDGNFQPKATIEHPWPTLTDEMRKTAVAKLAVVDSRAMEAYFIDFDPIAWMLRSARERV